MENYIVAKFERVVDLLRTTGTYTAVQVGITSVFTFTSNVDTFLDVDDYISLTDGLSTVKVRVIAITSEKVFDAESAGQNIPASGTWKALAPYSDYGTRKTINAKLLQKNGGEFAYQKYPLIALRLPVIIDVSGEVARGDANILIAHFTRKQYNPQERIENVFVPILYPLQTLFLDMIRRSGEFLGYAKDYQTIDRMFYGTESGDEQNIANIFDDPLDAIELRNLKLEYLIDECI